MKFWNLIVRLLAAIAVLALGAAASFAQNYPERPITLVVPYPAGGGNDVLGRLVAERMARALKGTIVVENRGGAGGTIGLAQFVNQSNGNPEALIVGGYVMVGAILTNASPVDLTMVTPIARLTGESVAIAVPAGTPCSTRWRRAVGSGAWVQMYEDAT